MATSWFVAATPATTVKGENVGLTAGFETVAVLVTVTSGEPWCFRVTVTVLVPVVVYTWLPVTVNVEPTRLIAPSPVEPSPQSIVAA